MPPRLPDSGHGGTDYQQTTKRTGLIVILRTIALSLYQFHSRSDRGPWGWLDPEAKAVAFEERRTILCDLLNFPLGRKPSFSNRGEARRGKRT
jgi:hypothetical protein